MLKCNNCQCQLKFDSSIVDRYPEWQNFSAFSKPAASTFRNSTASQKNSQASGHTKESLLFSTVSNTSSNPSQTSQISQLASPASPGGGFSNLGHSTTMLGNLYDIICNDVTALDNPICQECTDKLLDCMDQQMSTLEEECKEYRELLDDLKTNQNFPDLGALKSELLNLQSEEAGLQAELERLESEEVELDRKLIEEKEELGKMNQEEEELWKAYRNINRQIDTLDEENESASNQLKYAQDQLEKLQKTNAFNLTFHIWHSGHFGTINGFRLGRLPNQPVDWSEINAAWGQAVLLLHSLARKLGLKFKGYELFPYGNHSFIRCCSDNFTTSTSMEQLSKKAGESNQQKDLPLFCSGGYRFFWDTKFDSAMVAFLTCLQQLKEYLDSTGGGCLPYKMSKDKIEDKGNEYSVKIQFNSEERWTKAMKCTLTNLKWALVCVASM